MVDISVSGFEKTRSSWALVSVFTLSIFLSAALLFSVQPLFAKLVLPLLGGSSSVWNTAMVFFQAMLLGGYIYAHLISKYFSFRTQIITHCFVLSMGFLFLPLSIAQGWTPPEGGTQAYWLIGLFSVSVGMPFFAISANAPLLQRWFSRTNDKDAEDPYFLYSASNAGSLLSLCLYPLLFEPMLRLHEQTELWATGYVLLFLMILLSGFFGLKNRQAIVKRVSGNTESAVKPQLMQRLIWIGLAFIPSSLMLGVTSHMTNNIASAPLLWIIPLALYLLTFIFAFAKRPLIKSEFLRYLVPMAVIISLAFGVSIRINLLLTISLILISYFIIALACHTRLVEQRPHANYLTEFYIWMSLGGMLGGIFNALIAPSIFPKIYEYVIVICVAAFVYYTFDDKVGVGVKAAKAVFRNIAISAVVFVVLFICNVPLAYCIIISGGILSLGLAHLSTQKRTMFCTLLLMTGLLSFIIPAFAVKDVMTDRSFFGVLRVEAEESEHGTVHSFVHGDTVHNYQFQNDFLKRIPLAYYSEGNTFHRGLEFARHLQSDQAFNVSMIGLGAGAMACYEKPSENWVYFEIDPAVVDMATNEKYFSYMKDCSYASDIRIGDARLKLEDIPKGSQDYIIVDAFSSDSIPAHLVTVEALELYRSRLKPNGLIFFHTSNRVLDVNSVVATLAEHAGLESRYTASQSFEGNPYAEFENLSTAVILGTTEQMAELDKFDPQWKRITPSPDVGLWSDGYSHILGTLKAKYKKNVRVFNSVDQSP
ncbi:fused MFS/spermidine synthase [Hellea sp.]|nr:fused MFS/spermidine synthase [Hellea sp.]